ncbi:MAG: hypothetical protein ACLPPV_10145 [Candidatus Korobacteraceae bacterium]|jgi:hypothetical protein
MSQGSNSPSPFRDGFAALRHEPVLLAAELTWRWCFGLAAWGLGIIAIALFLDSLRVAPVDQFLLRTLQPQLLENALRHIFRGSLSRFVLEQTVLFLGVTVLWSLAATAGRAATLRRLVAMFSSDEEPQSMHWQFAPIFLLQLLRVLWTMIAVAVGFGVFLYGVVMAQNGHPMRAALALSAGLGVPFLAIVLNWFFGVAPLFCIRNGADAMEALKQAVDFTAEQAGRLFLLAVGFFALRLVWAGTMWLAFLSPLNWIAQIGGRWTMLLMAAVALVYFAGADLLYLARLAGYVSLVEDDSHPAPTIEPAMPPASNQKPEILPLVGLA